MGILVTLGIFALFIWSMTLPPVDSYAWRQRQKRIQNRRNQKFVAANSSESFMSINGVPVDQINFTAMQEYTTYMKKHYS